MDELKQLAYIVETGRTREVADCVRQLLEQGIPYEQIVDYGFMVALNEVGRKFDAGEYFITEMLMAARAVKLGCEAMRDYLGDSMPSNTKKIVIGTVEGDLHDIGKNLVAMTMRGVGIDVIDLGVDVPTEHFVRAVEQDESVALVGVSALLSTTIPAMKKTVQALKNCKAAHRITVMVGGAPVTEAMARECGADIYTKSAFIAAQTARRILEKES